MKNYPHLLSPVRVGKMVLKNRFVSSNSLPHFLQGSEPFPSEQVIGHVVSQAKNGAAVVTFADWTNKKQRESFNEDGKRFPMYDLDDLSNENYICQLADQVHSFGSRISIAIMPFTALDPIYDVCDVEAMPLPGDVATTFREGQNDYHMGALMRGGKPGKALSHAQIREIIEIYAGRVRYYQKLGFDMATLHFAYRATLFSRFISPITNKRTDEYGGDIRGRGRFAYELCARIKELCGKDFPIELQITGSEKGGTAIGETIEFAKMMEGMADIFQFRADSPNANHPTGYNSRKHRYEVLADCAAVKASGTPILCEVVGGFQDVDDAEEIIATGKADLIGAARAFFVDGEYYRKIVEGRPEDIVPCVRCNKCHVPSLERWFSLCTVNPTIGIAHKLDKFIEPVRSRKKVAVVGGGPAGMNAALICAKRGHAVTLYEKENELGGQLKIMDYPSFKWPLADYRRYLVGQLGKSGVDVRLGTSASPEMLRAGGFDAIVLALGASPKKPPLPGADKAWDILGVFGHEKELGKRVVVVGGSESGTEAGMYLAENGHEVTIITRQRTLAPDATPIHYRECIDEYIATLDGFHDVRCARTTEIGAGYVGYTDSEGKECRIECDDVVALGGMEPRSGEAMAFYGIARETYMIGDCHEVGCVRDCTRMAFVTANQI
ncbi:MAG: FAD-dependent oxidoreductase [Lachnospiraceae bacterium]|jgi:2,4-dienoyl-CoA reductase-like NADH-dependent reductase (Old Yellow Enzyme family)|nr:FAD-dependent oxidoreductase [Lachnospiraceae bacterium]